MEAQHTKGPWTWTSNYGEARFKLIVEGVNDGHAQIAECDVKNVHLIAAAPELLEACEIVLAGLDARITEAPRNSIPVFAGIAQMFSAISKAKGEI